MKQFVSIEVFGQKYNFESTLTEDEFNEVRDLLFDEIRKAEEQHKGNINQVSKLAILISASLNISKENIELKRHQEAFKSEVNQRAKGLMKNLDKQINENIALKL